MLKHKLMGKEGKTAMFRTYPYRLSVAALVLLLAAVAPPLADDAHAFIGAEISAIGPMSGPGGNGGGGNGGGGGGGGGDDGNSDYNPGCEKNGCHDDEEETPPKKEPVAQPAPPAPPVTTVRVVPQPPAPAPQPAVIAAPQPQPAPAVQPEVAEVAGVVAVQPPAPVVPQLATVPARVVAAPARAGGLDPTLVASVLGGVGTLSLAGGLRFRRRGR